MCAPDTCRRGRRLGWKQRALPMEWDLGDMERLMRVNYFGTIYFTKALLPQMVERQKGWLVFVASVAGKIASPT